MMRRGPPDIPEICQRKGAGALPAQSGPPNRFALQARPKSQRQPPACLRTVTRRPPGGREEVPRKSTRMPACAADVLQELPSARRPDLAPNPSEKARNFADGDGRGLGRSQLEAAEASPR